MPDTITVTGNIAADPEQRPLNSGGTVTSFRLASTHRRLDRERNEWVDAYTNWYNVSAFRALGEHAFASFRRGDRVVVTGRFRLREWDTGTKRGVSAEIDAEALGHDLLWGTSTFVRAAGRSPARGSESAASETSAAPAPAPVDDDGWAIPAGEPQTVGAETPF